MFIEDPHPSRVSRAAGYQGGYLASLTPLGCPWSQTDGSAQVTSHHQTWTAKQQKTVISWALWDLKSKPHPKVVKLCQIMILYATDVSLGEG